ncbi:hypothetical protein Tco_1573749, partial [Tanacetum coccineum]
MILVLKTSHHGPSDAMHNPSQLLRLLSKEVCFISHGDQHASIGFLIPRSLILKSSQAVIKSPTHYPCDNCQNIRVILFSIHSDDGNPSRVNIKQLYGRKIVTIDSSYRLSAMRRLYPRTASTAAKPGQGDSFEFYLITGSFPMVAASSPCRVKIQDL